MPNWLTIALSAIAAAAPGFITAIPAPYNTIISGAITLVSSLYHLFQTSPSSSGGK